METLHCWGNSADSAQCGAPAAWACAHCAARTAAHARSAEVRRRTKKKNQKLENPLAGGTRAASKEGLG